MSSLQDDVEYLLPVAARQNTVAIETIVSAVEFIMHADTCLMAASYVWEYALAGLKILEQLELLGVTDGPLFAVAQSAMNIPVTFLRSTPADEMHAC